MIMVFVSAATLAGCTSLAPRCHPGSAPRVVDTLYFGTARAAGVVSADEWRGFVDRSITPRFPSGLTSWRADGQWRGASGTIEREAAYVLQIVHNGDAGSQAALRDLVRDYRVQFTQEAVLRTSTHVCAGFGVD
jgi:hypothetical protein